MYNKWYCVKCGSSGVVSEGIRPAPPNARSKWRRFSSLIVCPVCGDAKGHAGILGGSSPVPRERGDLVAIPFDVPMTELRVFYPQLYDLLSRKGLNKTFRKVQIVLWNDRYGIYFPIRKDGKEVGFQIRFAEGRPKYITSKGLSLSSVLYGYEDVSGPSCVLVEGIFDTFVLPGYAVASFGKKVSKEQEELLLTKFRRVVVAFDADALNNAIRTALRLFRKGLEAFWLVLPRGSPADFTREELLQMRCVDPFFRRYTLAQVLEVET